ncbi:MAG: T9SS type A sorting domain-containing protein, partial [Bacteroidetes bacterium]|nr:T9SS type A sorting domain-containing protein [Bacteroidota bacterium]
NYFTVQVLDLTGQVLLYYPKIEQDHFDIRIPQLASNCYIVRINTDDGSQYSQKLISIR